ncbi:MAG: helix-turn-helix domain-containing protein [Pyrinomonadaceae bacterium]
MKERYDQFETTHNADNGTDVKTITEPEFCKLAGISISTALALRKAGKLAHCRVGRRVLYIYPRHVEEFLGRTERKPKAA